MRLTHSSPKLIPGPHLQRPDTLGQQISRKHLRLIHEIVLVAVLPAVDARVVNGDVGSTLPAHQVVDRLPGQLPLEIPQRNVQRGKCTHFRASKAIEIRPAEHRVPDMLGVEYWLIQHEIGDHVVNDRLHGSRQVKSLAQPDHAVVGMDPNPQNVRLRLIANCLYGQDFVHASVAV